MNWRELVEAVESESRRLGVPLDHLEVTLDGRPIRDIATSLLREDFLRPGFVDGVEVHKKTVPAIKLFR